MGTVIAIVGVLAGTFMLFVLWCCIRVGSLEERKLMDELEMEWLHDRRKKTPDE